MKWAGIVSRRYASQVQPTGRSARFAIDVFEPAMRGQGIGTETTRRVLGFATERLGPNRVELRVLKHRLRATACYEKYGFIREERERETVPGPDGWHSAAIMSILVQEYRPASPARE